MSGQISTPNESFLITSHPVTRGGPKMPHLFHSIVGIWEDAALVSRAGCLRRTPTVVPNSKSQRPLVPSRPERCRSRVLRHRLKVLSLCSHTNLVSQILQGQLVEKQNLNPCRGWRLALRVHEQFADAPLFSSLWRLKREEPLKKWSTK